MKKNNPYGQTLDAVRLQKEKLEKAGNPFKVIIEIAEDSYVCKKCGKSSVQYEKDEIIDKLCQNCDLRGS